MSDFFRKRWVLIVVLIVFVICKIPHLFHAYYWDESWVYAPAIKEMYHNGISLLPNAISEYYSRGHPLFFHAMGAMWVSVFGGSHISMHSFALFISLLLFVAIYEAGLRLFNQWVAIFALVLTVTQVGIFVQSSFMLPEMLVALLAFAALYFYVQDKYIQATVCLACLFLTKESGLVAGAVIGIDALAGLFYRETGLKKRMLRLMTIAVPVFVVASFFVCQKYMKGWYLFPSHMDTLITNWGDYLYRLRWCCLRDVFVRDDRGHYFLLLAFLIIAAAIKNRKAKFLLFLVPVVLTGIITDDSGITLFYQADTKIIFAPLILSYCFSAYLLSTWYGDLRQKRFVILSCLFAMSFICFSSALTYTVRYIFGGLVPVLFILAVLLDVCIRNLSKVVYYPVLAIILVHAFFAFRHDKGWGDTSLGAFKAVEVQERVVTYLERSNYYDKNLGTGSFQTVVHLTVPNSGFLSTGKIFSHASGDVNAATEVFVCDNIEPDTRYEVIKHDSTFLLTQRFTNGAVWAEIYERKK